MKSEKEKMLAGELYDAADPQLAVARQKCRLLLKQYNDSDDNQIDVRENLLRELLGAHSDHIWIEPPFYCDYGWNISVGEKVYMNFNCLILDVAPVNIGSYVQFGPNVQVYTATHPLKWQERANGLEFAKPISIGDHVWIGGGAIILPGVQIGDRAVIGAGSVVTNNIPADTFAAGNPCRVIRELD